MLSLCAAAWLLNINGTPTKRTRATLTSGKLSTGAFVVTADIDLGTKTVAVSGGVALFGPPGGPMPKISLGYFKLAAGASFSINRRVHELSRHVELQIRALRSHRRQGLPLCDKLGYPQQGRRARVLQPRQ